MSISIASISEKYADLISSTSKATKSYQNWLDFSADVKAVSESEKKTQKEILTALCPAGTAVEDFINLFKSSVSRSKAKLISPEAQAIKDKAKEKRAADKADAEAKAKAVQDELATFDGKFKVIGKLLDGLTLEETQCVQKMVNERVKALTVLRKAEKSNKAIAEKTVVIDRVVNA